MPDPDPYLDLQAWIRTHCSLGDPVRDEAYRCGLSAVVHRIIKWGFEETLNTLSARDCMTCCLLVGAEVAEMFLRTAFTRAIVEDDLVVLQRLMKSPFIPQSRAWLVKLGTLMGGDEEALKEGARWVETMRGEELILASILMARAAPQIADIAWLDQAADVPPAVAASLCRELMKQERFQTVVRNWVRTRPAVRYAGEDYWGI